MAARAAHRRQLLIGHDDDFLRGVERVDGCGIGSRDVEDDVAVQPCGGLDDGLKLLPMRGLSELGKLISPNAALAAESIRYLTYELQQRIVLRRILRRLLRDRAPSS